MEHLQKLGVPGLVGAEVAIELQLVGLTVVVLLDSVSGMVAVLGIQVGDMHHDDRRRVRPFLQLIDVGLHIFRQLLVLLVIEIVLVKDDDAKFVGVSGKFD